MVALYDDNMTLEKILLIGHKSRQNFVSFIFESNDTQTYLHQKNYSMKTMSMMKKLLQNTFLFISNNPYCEMQLSSMSLSNFYSDWLYFDKGTLYRLKI